MEFQTDEQKVINIEYVELKVYIYYFELVQYNFYYEKGIY